ncbi:DNA polymerase I [Arthrobacter sp. StoSoilB3]|uniref:DNA polymerase I n=1 Tax=Paenarthrobacter nicotinovorans TaxID=29320 RepID=UPI00036BEE71|nr:DNA polymerase I [Arthrobacter sp. NtRootA2]BCW14792.1 DNA polymerase I [Arthrobacter sp. NtRootA4]BCW23127.1 DNA polymerase I [Arthrobacter sp. NtRootC7]BCW27394.1 DNA polymerase I [Arthrobacter sp. NtRootC45]BCW31661.1 DNA polymerase I [Arthrobacter sp. NtRootD5]BCW40549.1 DNA polymerase I [Arthrobacter sp. StoSoilB3]
MAFRAFYALPAENFSTARGQYTNAVHGFTSMLINLIKDQKPTHVAVAFDVSDDTTFRKAEYSEYKGGRNATPAEFAGQIGLIARVMEAWGIKTIAMPGYEADDVLATLASQADAAGFEVLLVSGDRDAFQLINDNVFVLYPKQGVSNIPKMDAAAIEEKYFVKPGLYSDLAALVGESADNLPGVPGVGPKTAAKWINLYGGLEGILENLDSIGGKVGGALKENLENVKRNRRLNQLLTDLELPITLEDLHEPRPDRQAIEELFEELEFRTLRTRLFDLYGDDTAGAAPDTIDAPEFDSLTDASGLEAFFAAGSGMRSALAVQLVPGRVGDDASALAIVRANGAAFIELTGLDAAAEEVLARWLRDPEEAKVLHEFKSALKALHNRGLGLEGVVDDTSISGYLIQPDRRSYDLAELAQVHLKISLATAASQSGQLELDLSGDTDQAAAAALVQHAAVVHALSKHFEKELADRKADALLTTLELPVARVLAQMELTGIFVSTDRMDEQLADLTKVIQTAQEQAFAAIGHEVNLGSPKQLQTVLFEELGLPKTKKIKSGYTTDAASLKALLEKTGHEFLVQLMAHRESSKLAQMVETLKKSVADDGRIHTTYAQNIAATGRISSNNPNLQNIPVRSEEGRRVRGIFVVSEGYECLLSADYSQIEMRIMAHLSGDEALIQAYRDGEDLHRFVGSRIFNVAPAEVTSAMRSKVKAMSYGLAYGLTSFGLSKQLEISVDEARTLMKDYFDRFGGVRDYLRGVVDQARTDGYTATIEGRRRYLPDLTSTNRQAREAAERIALNSPIQGSAADLIKRAMLGVSAELASQGLKSRMLLQVHDELVLEVAPGEREAVEKLVIEQMGSAADLSVPLDVQIGVGSSWYEAGH